MSDNYNKLYKQRKRQIDEIRSIIDLESPNLNIEITSNNANTSSNSNVYNVINDEYLNIPYGSVLQSTSADIDDNISSDSYISSDDDQVDSNNIFHSDIDIQSNIISDEEFISRLRSQFIKYKVPHNFIDENLKLLKQKGISQLPYTARTFLKTSPNNEIIIKSDVKYYYFGIQNMIIKYFEKYLQNNIYDSNDLHLSLNIDGLPLFKSTNLSMWPILISIKLEAKKSIVFPVTLTLGNKPKNMDFLWDSINELKILMTNNIVIKGKIYTIILDAIICDAPAKSFIKCIKQYNGYYGCDKCDMKGVMYSDTNERRGRMTYPDINFNKRTDSNFRNRSNPLHHHSEISPFEELPINMILVFPTDYMHCVLLGVMKKLLKLWVFSKNCPYKLSALQISQINDKMNSLKQFIPYQCFSRLPRSLYEVDRWKATEYRLFLLYIGKIVLHDVMSSVYRYHFLVLNMAISLLLSDNSASNINLAEFLLNYFVEEGIKLYGDKFPIFNVHSLLHLADDARTHGSLDNISAFKFENYLGSIKKMIRGSKNPLIQVVNRVKEDIQYGNHSNGIRSNIQYKAYKLSKKSFCEILPNNYSLSIDYDIYSLCRLYTSAQDYFSKMINNVYIKSSDIGCIESSYANCRIKPIEKKLLIKPGLLICNDQESIAIFLQLLHFN